MLCICMNYIGRLLQENTIIIYFREHMSIVMTSLSSITDVCSHVVIRKNMYPNKGIIFFLIYMLLECFLNLQTKQRKHSST